MADILAINGENIADLGMFIPVSGLGEAWSRPGYSRSYVPVPKRTGAVPLALATGMEKRIPIVLVIPSTVANRSAALDAVVRKLDGILELEWEEQEDRVQYGILDTDQIAARFAELAFLTGDLAIRTEIIIPSAVSVAKSPVMLAVGTTAALLTGLGTYPSEGIFYFGASITDLLITYKHGLTGDTLASLQATGTSAASTILEVDVARRRIVEIHTTTGVRTERMDLISSTSFGTFPVFDPGDGTAANPPTITTSAAGTLYYRGVYGS